jgi:hypothetical protein
MSKKSHDVVKSNGEGQFKVFILDDWVRAAQVKS